ncbi:MAG TPA: response regulator transcription factor [Pyrinomonadaceae bacterium]|jgi:DNA-binding response OmpR family regulator|nr:response regulator transcription factor [Pyrinomonadaceae bacterium]
MRILIVEDEQHLAEGLCFNLEVENFDVEIAADGAVALRLLLEEKEKFDAIILDVMLPEVDGFTVAKTLREAKDYTPILMLTARGRPEDVLEGFASGADDYLPKPFELSIFQARLRGLLRRQGWSREEKRSTVGDIVTVNGKTIDFENLQLQSNDEVIHLTLMEAKLLRYLVEHAETPVSRKTILEDIWGLHEDTDTRAIDNFIVRLRRYLEDEPNNPKIVQTVRGIGYRFVNK